jgi:2,4-dienoyl-CoA reductase-like NADH-dependent reductase (Old Yellow Enzyme family)
MPLDETIATFGHFLREADGFNLAYITLIRYLSSFDIEIDGKKRATRHDVPSTFRPFIKNTPVFLNGNISLTDSADEGGVTVNEASKLIEEGTIDAVVLGRPWISHPDLVKRFEQGKPMDQESDFMTLYGVDPTSDIEAQRKGYTDYPFATA